MLSITRGTDRPTGDAAPRARRGRLALLVSVGVNAALALGFFHAVLRGYNWRDLLDRPTGEVPAERISFYRLPAGPTSQPGRSGGDGRPVAAGVRARVPRFVPPTTAPAPAPATAEATPVGVPGREGVAGGSGDVVGSGGATEGMRPTYADPRLWARPGSFVSAPKSAKQRIDSVIAEGLGPVRDSIAAAQALAAGQRQPGDWTVKGRGGTWGMDQRNIHLGKIKVPTALLGLLSSNFQKNLRGNPTEMANERRLAEVRRDLMDHAQREIAEDDFRGAVRAIRARKDRERNQRLAERRRAADETGAVGADAAAGGPPPR